MPPMPKSTSDFHLSSLIWRAQVIDAEMARRKMLEDNPIPSLREDPVFFDTAEIPWWAWVRRFHLPEVCFVHDKVHFFRSQGCLLQDGAFLVLFRSQFGCRLTLGSL